MLVLDSERERNAAILLARRFARDQNVRVLPLEIVPCLSANLIKSITTICGFRHVFDCSFSVLKLLSVEQVTLFGPDDGISVSKISGRLP